MTLIAMMETDIGGAVSKGGVVGGKGCGPGRGWQCR
jgi:hypothetical protein